MVSQTFLIRIGFRTYDDAKESCSKLYSNDFGTECCSKLIPGVQFLALSSPPVFSLAAGIGIAVGIGAFLILIALMVSIMWLTAPSSKERPPSVSGNGLLRADSAFSMSDKDSIMFRNDRDSRPFTDEYEDGAKISVYNPYNPPSTAITAPVEWKAKNTFAYRESFISDTSALGKENPYRRTIDLDTLDTNGPNSIIYDPASMKDFKENYNKSDRDSSVQPIYDSVYSHPVSMYSQMISMHYGTDIYQIDNKESNLRDSTLSFNLPPPPPKAP